MRKKRFLEEETNIYDAAYQEICDEVARFAKENDIGLVIRVNREDEHKSPQSVMRKINRHIVYNEDRRDITLEILARLNGSTSRSQDAKGKDGES